MDVANIKSDLRRDGGRDPANTKEMTRGNVGVLIGNHSSLVWSDNTAPIGSISDHMQAFVKHLNNMLFY